MRITHNMMMQNFLTRSRDSLARVAKWQSQISSGRKLQSASDNPGLLNKSLSIRSDLREVAAYRDNISSATAHMSVTEASLSELSDLLSRARELVVQGATDTSEAGGTEALARELRAILDEVLIVSNREVAGRYLFSGTQTGTPAYGGNAGNISYRGNERSILEEVSAGLRVGINLTGPDAFETVPSSLFGTADLDPAVSTITRLADLNDGRGATPGILRLTDSNGLTAEVDAGNASSIGGVMAAINGAGTAIVASLSTDGRSLVLTDTGGGPGMQVEDIFGGTLAQDLGVAGTFVDGTVTGRDLDPRITEDTPIALLFGGSGAALGTVTLRNDSENQEREGSVDLSGANTVGELLDLLESAKTTEGTPLGLRASVRNGSIVLESTRLHTRLSVQDASGSGARTLGILGTGESRDVFQVLESAAAAIESRDHDALDSVLEELSAAVDNTAGIRGTYGARSRQVLRLAQNLDNQVVDLTIRLSDVEDVDLAEAAMELSRADTVYNASLAVGMRIFERNLFDYIR